METRLEEAALRRLLRVGRAVVSELDLDAVLEQVLEAAVELSGARYAALGVLDESRTGLASFIHRGIDEETAERIGELPRGRGVLGALIDAPEPLRLADVAADPRSYGFPPGHPPMNTFLGVPISIRGEEWGNLYLTEKEGGGEFSAEDEAAAVVLAGWAAIAIGNARSVAADRLRQAMAAAEQERLQWARELHDESLQGLAALRMILATGRRGDADEVAASIERALGQIDAEIAAMRGLISDLRPDSLDELGIEASLSGLAHRLHSRYPGTEVVVSAPPRSRRLPGSVEIALYRVAQEAATNAIRHGGAGRVEIALDRSDGSIRLTVGDDGGGFDPEAVARGYGITGMEERAELVGGDLRFEATPGRGTTVTLEVGDA